MSIVAPFGCVGSIRGFGKIAADAFRAILEESGRGRWGRPRTPDECSQILIPISVNWRHCPSPAQQIARSASKRLENDAARAPSAE
jgi:hypothetical protein